MVVAFELAESPEMRIFNAAATNDWNRPRNLGLGTYWCAADKPDDSVCVRRVYRTHEVPKDAACATCGISIVELQAELGSLGRAETITSKPPRRDHV
jgi:hypothetical protein